MAGHSKWANIKHKKAANDKKRAKAFAIASKEIMSAIQKGGNNPENNSSLRLAIEKAKSSSVPGDNIQRLIDKGNKDKTDYKEIRYEGYGPGGTAIIIDCLTDNINRTVSSVKSTLTKKGGSLGTSNSVAYLFKNKTQIVFESTLSEEKLMEAALENNATDFEKNDNFYIVESEPRDWINIQDALKNIGVNDFVKSEIGMVPDSLINLDDEKMNKLDNLIEALEDLEDVSKVFSNVEE